MPSSRCIRLVSRPLEPRVSSQSPDGILFFLRFSISFTCPCLRCLMIPVRRPLGLSSERKIPNCQGRSVLSQLNSETRQCARSWLAGVLCQCQKLRQRKPRSSKAAHPPGDKSDETTQLHPLNDRTSSSNQRYVHSTPSSINHL
jgi:hypothetical protein